MDFAVSKGLQRWNSQDRYDVLFLSHTLEHWTEPFEDLKALVTDNLESDGLLIIEVPLVDRLVLGGRPKGFGEETHLAHIWYFTVWALDKLVGKLGFERQFTDRRTTCIYKRVESTVSATIAPTPIRDRLMMGTIELSRNPICRSLLQQANKFVKYVDVDFSSVDAEKQ